MLPESLQNPQIPGEIAQSAPGEPTGLFALALSQLTIEAPAIAPIAPGNQPAFRPLAPETPGQLLPPAGNGLPQLPGANTGVEDTIAITVELTDEIVAATGEQAELLAVPGLPQATGIAPEVTPIVDTRASPAPPTAHSLQLNAPRTQANAQPAQPEAPSQSASTPVAESLSLSRPAVPAPVNAAADIASDPARQTDNRQPVQAVAAEPLPALAGTNTNTIQTTATPLAATPPQHSYTIGHPIADNRWGESLGQRVMWMTDNGIGRAEIRLNPPELGPLEIRLTVTNDEAKVAFSVQHGTTREAVESAMPRLREMFAQQGIDLTDASVSQQSPDERRETGDAGSSTHNTNHTDTQTTESGDADAIAAGRTHSREGIIDTYV